jgi:hypothetical protein
MGMYPGGKIIRVTPTLSTDAYADGDVLFDPVELPNAVPSRGGVSLLRSMYIIDKEKQTADIQFSFFENSTSLGTVNATANIAHDDYVNGNFLGMWMQDADTGESADIDNLTVNSSVSLDGGGTSAVYTGPMLIQAAEGSRSIYVTGHLSSGTPTYAADSLQLIFNVQYIA